MYCGFMTDQGIDPEDPFIALLMGRIKQTRPRMASQIRLQNFASEELTFLENHKCTSRSRPEKERKT